MQLKTSAIVLHSIKYSDTSLILHTYTETHGRMAYVVTGVKSKKSVLRSSMLLPLTILGLETDYNPNKELQRIKESHIGYAFKSLPFDPSKNALAIFMAEMLYRSLKEPHTDPELYGFLYQSICALDGTRSGIGNFHLSFLIQFSQFMGFGPQYSTYADNTCFDLQNGIFILHQQALGSYLNKNDSRLFATVCGLNYQNMAEYTFTKEEKKLLLTHLLSYYQIHLHRFSHIKSLDILYQLFA